MAAGLNPSGDVIDAFLNPGPLVANFSSWRKSVLEFVSTGTFACAGERVLRLDCIISAVKTLAGLSKQC